MDNLFKRLNLVEKILFWISAITAIPLPLFDFAFIFGKVSIQGQYIFICLVFLFFVPLLLCFYLHNKRVPDDKIGIDIKNFSFKGNWLGIVTIIIFMYAVYNCFIYSY